MNEQQIKDWLGVGAVDRPLNPDLTEAMADVPWPEDDDGHMAAYMAFLRGAPGEPGHRAIFADQAEAAELEAQADTEQADELEAFDRQNQAETEAP